MLEYGTILNHFDKISSEMKSFPCNEAKDAF